MAESDGPKTLSCFLSRTLFSNTILWVATLGDQRCLVLEQPSILAITAPCYTMSMRHQRMLCLEQTKVQQKLTVASMRSRSVNIQSFGRLAFCSVLKLSDWQVQAAMNNLSSSPPLQLFPA